MDTSPQKNEHVVSRVLIIGLLAVILIASAILVLRLTGGVNVPVPERVDALAGSTDSCVECHRNASPGIVQQFGYSSMAASNIICSDCHVVTANYPGAVEHEGAYILAAPTTAMCQRCHPAEVNQYMQSRHSLPAYVAVAGSQDLSPELLAAYKAIPEGSYAPDKSRHILAQMEGKDLTRFACESCHNVGAPAVDQSVGECQKCHIRHEFSLEQARKPETCNNCHIGPDHPQWEIYQESPHGISYSTMGANWNWDADSGTLTVKDFPAPTCATCHLSGFGGAATTHDVGDRLTWYLFAPISERRPTWQNNQVRMQTVCMECHNKNFIDAFYTDANKATLSVNDFVKQSDAVMKSVKDEGLLTPAPFDEEIEYEYFELWHHWGRTAKFGVWMQGPDYTQWHGAYEVVKALSNLKEMAADMLASSGEQP
ncbi:MAG: multiheme c-type cytochrome [Anaerolineaceae bacterium]